MTFEDPDRVLVSASKYREYRKMRKDILAGERGGWCRVQCILLHMELFYSRKTLPRGHLTQVLHPLLPHNRPRRLELV